MRTTKAATEDRPRGSVPHAVGSCNATSTWSQDWHQHMDPIFFIINFTVSTCNHAAGRWGPSPTAGIPCADPPLVGPTAGGTRANTSSLPSLLCPQALGSRITGFLCVSHTLSSILRAKSGCIKLHFKCKGFLSGSLQRRNSLNYSSIYQFHIRLYQDGAVFPGNPCSVLPQDWPSCCQLLVQADVSTRHPAGFRNCGVGLSRLGKSSSLALCQHAPSLEQQFFLENWGPTWSTCGPGFVLHEHM